MKRPTKQDLTDAFAYVGLKKGDVVYLSSQLYGIGPLADAPSREDYLTAIHGALKSVIGDLGTLVVPTFTPQVGRFGLPFILEETESLTGILGEYVRKLPGSIRSLHPVFSVAAIGHRANDICINVSPVAFGTDSAFDRLVRFGAKIVSMGFDEYSGYIVSLVHFVETSFAVPYYYNKLVESPVYANGLLVNKPFIINVKYLGLDCQFDMNRYVAALAVNGQIHAKAIGRGYIHLVDAKEMFETGVKLLKEDIYAFLLNPPNFRRGEIPMDGPPDLAETPQGVNWAGFGMYSR